MIKFSLNFEIEYEEESNKFFCDCLSYPGVMAYGDTCSEAYLAALSLLGNVLKDKHEHDESVVPS